MEMQKHIIDEKTGISYTLCGDYYLPDLKLPEQEAHEIGRFGNAHRRYLRENRKAFYQSMLISGKLNQYLHDVDESCNEAYERLMKAYAQREGVTELLKAEQPMEWVRLMNNIKNRVEEVIFSDFVYV
jgi:hypothetical protein